MNRMFLGALTAAIVMLASPAAGQDHGDHHGAQGAHHTKTGWKELDAYHTLLAATWHPASGNDLKPLRAKADSLSAAAKTWRDAAVPVACDTREIKAAIADVATGTTKVLHLVHGNAADAELKAALHDVHERFEVVEKGCKPGKAHH